MSDETHGPCECDVCGNRCDGRAIEHGRGCYVANENGRGTSSCDCDGPLIDYAIGLEEKLVDSERRIAHLEGALAGWQRRALEAEQERDEWARRWEGMRTRGDRAYRSVDLITDRLERERAQAYASGRRDALAVAQHRSELERDVIEAAKKWNGAHPDDRSAVDALEHAVRVLVDAERAK